MQLRNLLLTLLLPFTCLAQYTPIHSFRIMHVPNKIALENPGIRDTLNKAIAGITSDKKVFAILNKYLDRYRNLPVYLREQLGGNKFNIYVFDISAPKARATSIVDFNGVRGNIFTPILYNKSDIQTFFSDTLAIWDSLNIKLDLADYSVGENKFYIRSTNTADTFDIPIESNEHELIINVNKFQQARINVNDKYVQCNLFNSKNASDTLGTFALYFLTDEDKGELQDFYTDLKIEYAGKPENTKANFAHYIRVYASVRWGYLNIPTIVNQLLKNK